MEASSYIFVNIPFNPMYVIVFFSSLVLGITSAIWASYWLSVRRMKVWMCVIVLLQNNFRHHVQWNQNTYVEILHSFIWQWMILLQDFGRTWIAISIQLLYTNISVMVWQRVADVPNMLLRYFQPICINIFWVFVY